MLDRNIHKTILLQILKEIYTDTSLGPLLGLKGGTAAFLFYGLGRFSMDLDFDLLHEIKEDYVYERIGEIIKEFGKIKDQFKKRHTLFFVLSYSEKTPNIKLEINRRSFDARYAVQNYLGVSMLVMVKEDMFAHKLVALISRSEIAHRDIFDIWFFLKNHWSINQKIVEQRTGIHFKDYLQKCIGFIENLDERNILHGMGELLDEKQKAWAKIHLKQDILFLLKLSLENQL